MVALTPIPHGCCPRARRPSLQACTCVKDIPWLHVRLHLGREALSEMFPDYTFLPGALRASSASTLSATACLMARLMLGSLERSWAKFQPEMASSSSCPTAVTVADRER